MKNFFRQAISSIALFLLVFLATASPVFAKCDGWADPGSTHRNAGNGCTYTCSGDSWSGPNSCDGAGNGQFQGAAAQSEEERRNQAAAVAQRNAEAQAKVAQQGAAVTAAQAAATAEQRAKEATRQQAMVEVQRQQTVADLEKRFGSNSSEVAKANQDAAAAAQFVAAAQGTNRGQSIVGSGADVKGIAENGYDPNSELATGIKPTAAVGTGGGSTSGTKAVAVKVACNMEACGKESCGGVPLSSIQVIQLNRCNAGDQSTSKVATKAEIDQFCRQIVCKAENCSGSGTDYAIAGCISNSQHLTQTPCENGYHRQIVNNEIKCVLKPGYVLDKAGNTLITELPAEQRTQGVFQIDQNTCARTACSGATFTNFETACKTEAQQKAFYACIGGKSTTDTRKACCQQIKGQNECSGLTPTEIGNFNVCLQTGIAPTTASALAAGTAVKASQNNTLPSDTKTADAAVASTVATRCDGGFVPRRLSGQDVCTKLSSVEKGCASDERKEIVTGSTICVKNPIPATAVLNTEAKPAKSEAAVASTTATRCDNQFSPRRIDGKDVCTRLSSVEKGCVYGEEKLLVNGSIICAKPGNAGTTNTAQTSGPAGLNTTTNTATQTTCTGEGFELIPVNDKQICAKPISASSTCGAGLEKIPAAGSHLCVKQGTASSVGATVIPPTNVTPVRPANAPANCPTGSTPVSSNVLNATPCTVGTDYTSWAVCKAGFRVETVNGSNACVQTNTSGSIGPDTGATKNGTLTGSCNPNSGAVNSVGPNQPCCIGGVLECNSATTTGQCVATKDVAGTLGVCGAKPGAASSSTGGPAKLSTASIDPGSDKETYASGFCVLKTGRAHAVACKTGSNTDAFRCANGPEKIDPVTKQFVCPDTSGIYTMALVDSTNPVKKNEVVTPNLVIPQLQVQAEKNKTTALSRVCSQRICGADDCNSLSGFDSIAKAGFDLCVSSNAAYSSTSKAGSNATTPFVESERGVTEVNKSCNQQICGENTCSSPTLEAMNRFRACVDGNGVLVPIKTGYICGIFSENTCVTPSANLCVRCGGTNQPVCPEFAAVATNTYPVVSKVCGL